MFLQLQNTFLQVKLMHLLLLKTPIRPVVPVQVVLKRLLALQHLRAVDAGVLEEAPEVDAFHVVAQLLATPVREHTTDGTEVEVTGGVLLYVAVHVFGPL